MTDATRQLDQRFATLAPILSVPRPVKGWVRAIRDALGMTTAQLARRMGVTQPRIPEFEKAELHGNISIKSLERAAEALGCRVVYMLVPEKPLSDTLRARAERLADRQLGSVGHSMELENQAVDDDARARQRERSIEQLLRQPARLWDDP
jgi:predicted DNA-binding mobile mystery protein A